MTSVAVAVKEEQRIARPLRVLVPLIQDDLKHGREAEERAGMPYYRAAGEKLLEAKAQLKHGEFTGWVKLNCGVSVQQARRYMALAEEKETALSLATRRETLEMYWRCRKRADALKAELQAEREKNAQLQQALDYERASRRSWARKAMEQGK